MRYMPCGSAPLSAKVTAFTRCVMGCHVSKSVSYMIMAHLSCSPFINTVRSTILIACFGFIVCSF